MKKNNNAFDKAPNEPISNDTSTDTADSLQPSDSPSPPPVPDLGYSSIEELHLALSAHQYPSRLIYDYLIASQNDLYGSEAEYHNLSVEFANQNNALFAVTAARMGMKHYPLSTTLIADYIKYAQMCGKTNACHDGFDKLLAIDRKYWEWRTFVFSIDYLKDSFGAINVDAAMQDAPETETSSVMALMKKHEENIELAQKLIEEFKTHIPHEERSYVAEAEIYIQQSDYTKAIEILEGAINTIAVAPQCCMKLADLYLERGNYSEAIETATKGILAAIQDVPTVSTAYLYYIKAMGMDALRLQDRAKGLDIEDERTNEIITCYLTADRLFVNEDRESVRYRKTIMARLIIIQMEEYGQVNEALMPNIKDTQADQFQKIRELRELMALASSKD